MTQPLTRCSVCDSTTSTCCGVCVRAALTESLKSHQRATQQWRVKRTACITANTPTTRIPELQDTSLRLRNEMEELRRQCAAAAVRVCAWKVRNQENAVGTSTCSPLRSHLHRLEDSVTSSLELQIRTTEARIRRMRFQWAVSAFWMHRMDVKEIPDGQDVAGIGKIGGLPLPHVGSELFGVLPPEELQSALRLVAVVTYSVGQCLAIALPHPIVLHGRNPNRIDISEDGGADEKKSAKPSVPLSTAAILHESRDRSSQPYVLLVQNKEEFATAWQFLQNNILALAIRVGVPVGKLFPGESVLLNLYALREYCQEQATASMVDDSIEDGDNNDNDLVKQEDK